MKIAVLLTTYNRKEITLACLKNLNQQELPPGVDLQIFLTDDASTDGTDASVKELFPTVNLYHGSGQLFWAGGMRTSWTEALKTQPDFYLLLNDDTIFVSEAFKRLLSYYNESQFEPEPAILVGSTFDNSKGVISYGGHLLYNKNKVHSYTVSSETEFISCDYANANIMLVPKAIVQEIGILSDHYTHSIADLDYTLKARNKGFSVLVVPGILGYCSDDHGNNWKSQSSSLKDRITYLYSPKGLAYKEYMRFIGEHFPKHVHIARIKLWLKTFFPGLWDIFKK